LDRASPHAPSEGPTQAAQSAARSEAKPSEGPRLILGTAGHIDHGKTSLVRALTGVDTDRLPEEKARGITIELGFAPLDLDGGLRLSVVDVPGHEGLVRTMVAGATGIDLVLLVVAADEGVMPQTREHLAICELLGLEHGVVALTKTDLAPAELAALAAEEAAGLLAQGPLAGAPIVPVSAQTGAGLPELRAALLAAATRATPRTPRSGPPRLAVDRAFAMKGFGAVVTGTLLGRPLAVGDAVEIQPSGLRARVRGVQSHGEKRERGEPGSRCALNLQGVELAQLARGQVVSAPGALAPAPALDVSLAWLATAPRAQGPVSVELLAATCERRARVAPIGGDALTPGGHGFARIHVDGEPLPVLPGDRFIVRGFARSEQAGATLGGGVVLDVAPPHRRRSDPQLLAELRRLARREPRTDVAVRVARAGLAGVARERLLAETGLGADALDAALAALAADGRVLRAGSSLWLDASVLAALEERALGALAAWHAAEPLRPGIPARALRGRLPENVAPETFELALARLAGRGEIALEAELVRARAHEARLSEADRAHAERIAAEARAAGLEPPALREWSERLALPPEKLRELLAHLERNGALVRAPGDLWFDRGVVEALRERVIAYLREHGRLETPAYKSLIGTSRRSAVPLMELFDAEHVTARRGDARILRGGGAP
jgi:selenocysteine-specific elongation factor